MTNLPARQAEPHIAQVIPLTQPGRMRRILDALIGEPNPAPATDSFDDAMEMMAASREFVARIEAITARRRAAQVRRWGR